ncbi:MAG: LpqB family beta-propeller domain-containing protein [Sphingomonadaceae bacterium]
MERFLIFAALLVCACSNGAGPQGGSAAERPAQGPVLVIGNKGEDTVSFVDLATGEELARRETGPNPHEVAISPDGDRAAVVAYGGSSIDIFDVGRRELIRRIDISPNRRPHGIVWLDDGRIVATTEGSDTLTLVSADGEVSAIPTGQKGTHMIAVSPDARRAYAANMGSGTVSVIDLEKAKKIADLDAGAQPEGIALSPDGTRLWVADRQSDILYLFDTATLEREAALETGAFPIRVAVSPDGRIVVTSNLRDGSISLFDARRAVPLRTIEVSGDADAGQITILFSADSARLYVAETGADRIAEVDAESGEVLRRLPAGRQGDGLGIAGAGFE